MDKVFKDAWNAHSDDVRFAIREIVRGGGKYDVTYESLLRQAIGAMFPEEEYGEPDVDRIVVVDHGDYRGDLLFVIPERCYQPSTYWITSVSYGSCPGCDALEAAIYCDNDDYVVHDLWQIVLGIVEKAFRYDCLIGLGVE